jgi:hypothetical protein
MSRKEQESPTRLQREHQETVNKAFDQTRDNIKKTVNEAKKDVSVYAKQFTDLQEKAIETTMEIADNYIESQKEIVNSFNQSIWTPYVENVVNRTSAFPAVFSPSRAEVYGNTLTNIVDNFVTATRLANKTVSANTEVINISLQQARNNFREFSKIGITAVKNVNQTASEIAKIGYTQ